MQPTLDNAIEVFAQGYAFTRSFTHPSLVERIHGSVWVIRDAERRSGEYRGEEYIAHTMDAKSLHALALAHVRSKFNIGYILPASEDDASIRHQFRDAGYRLMATEAFMIHDLKDIAPVRAPYPVSRVATAEEAQRLAKAAGRRQILPQMLTQSPAPMRQYMALDGQDPIGWVGSVIIGDATWCANMYVTTSYRRKGVATALMTQMLQEDHASGATASVLLASHAGAELYVKLGYQQFATLYLYTPPKTRL